MIKVTLRDRLLISNGVCHVYMIACYVLDHTIQIELCKAWPDQIKSIFYLYNYEVGTSKIS